MTKTKQYTAGGQGEAPQREATLLPQPEKKLALFQSLEGPQASIRDALSGQTSVLTWPQAWRVFILQPLQGILAPLHVSPNPGPASPGWVYIGPIQCHSHADRRSRRPDSQGGGPVGLLWLLVL